MMNLLEFFEDPRPESEKGRVILIRDPPLAIHIPPRRRTVVPVRVATPPEKPTIQERE